MALPEGQAAADQVLPQARLGFVDAEGGSMAKRRPGQFGRDTLLVKPVAGLVERTEEGRRQKIWRNARCDAHVVGAE